MKAIYFTPGHRYLQDAFKEVEIEDKLDTYYKMIDCDSIDIVTVRIGGAIVNVVADDNGLFVDKPKVSIMNKSMSIYIVGKVVIAGRVDEDGYLTSLDNESIRVIKDSARLVTSRNLKTGKRDNMICLIADEAE